MALNSGRLLAVLLSLDEHTMKLTFASISAKKGNVLVIFGAGSKSPNYRGGCALRSTICPTMRKILVGWIGSFEETVTVLFTRWALGDNLKSICIVPFCPGFTGSCGHDTTRVPQHALTADKTSGALPLLVNSML